jgi:type III pantothenate kinase
MRGVVAVDIGNTRTSVGLVADGRVARTAHVLGGESRPAVLRRAIRAVARGAARPGACLCSVVPSLNRVWAQCLRRELGRRPLVVSHRLRIGVRVEYPHPETIGADRLANASGVVGRYGAPAIVADFGTAVTFDVVSAAGAYIGGVIGPGLPLMVDYLYEKTALLPRIRLQGPYGRVGRSTAGAMRIGAKIGYRGMVDEITEYLMRGLGMTKGRVRLVATGGYAGWALEGTRIRFRMDPDLTLYGIGRIYELNVPESRRGRRERG